MGLFESGVPIDNITVMVQKEAAIRIAAKPGTRDCGAISAAINYYSEPEKLFDVSKGNFVPPPNVTSAVIRLTLRKEPPVKVADERHFFRIVKASFSQRRKTLTNSLSSGLGKGKAGGWKTEAQRPAGTDGTGPV